MSKSKDRGENRRKSYQGRENKHKNGSDYTRRNGWKNGRRKGSKHRGKIGARSQSKTHHRPLGSGGGEEIRERLEGAEARPGAKERATGKWGA